MIFSTDFEQLAKLYPQAAAFWAAHDMLTLADGHYELGHGECVNVTTTTSHDRATGEYESHEKYLDIQCVISGQEIIEVAPLDGLEVIQELDQVSDCALYAGTVAGEQFINRPGRFAVVGPADAHMPGVAVGSPEQVKKAVFKIRVPE